MTDEWSELDVMEAAMGEITDFRRTLGTPKPIDWDAVNDEECRELLEATND